MLLPLSLSYTIIWLTNTIDYKPQALFTRETESYIQQYHTRIDAHLNNSIVVLNIFGTLVLYTAMLTYHEVD